MAEPASERRPLISIVVPARNEEGNMPRVYDEVTAAMARLPDCDHEVLIIDNDSTDRTGEISAELCRRDQRWRYIKFSRDFTSEISMAAGLRYSRGDAAVILFSDLQDPPDRIPDFVAKWREGHDIVYGVQLNRPGDPRWRNFTVAVYYWLMQRLSDVPLPRQAGDFRLYSRRAVNVINRLDERVRYLRGLSQWVGFPRCAVPYERRPRLAGESKAPFFYLIGFALKAVTSFSVKPLRMFTVAGAVGTLITLLLALLLVFNFIFNRSVVPGLTTTHVLLLANLSVMLIGFGVLGEYLGHLYTEGKHRPLWVVEKTINLDLEGDDETTPFQGRVGGL